MNTIFRLQLLQRTTQTHLCFDIWDLVFGHLPYRSCTSFHVSNSVRLSNLTRIFSCSGTAYVAVL